MYITCQECLGKREISDAKYESLKRRDELPLFCGRMCWKAWIRRVNTRVLIAAIAEEWKKKMDNAVLKARPVTRLAEMPREKQEELKKLYSSMAPKKRMAELRTLGG